jgi:hypothetical protein
MFLAEKTVKNYVSSLLAKLGLERRTQAAVLATRLLPRPAQHAAADRGGGVPAGRRAVRRAGRDRPDRMLVEFINHGVSTAGT